MYIYNFPIQKIRLLMCAYIAGKLITATSFDGQNVKFPIGLFLSKYQLAQFLKNSVFLGKFHGS